MKHCPALDGLRGIAVAMVVIVHSTELAPHWRFAWLTENGYLGVDMFFVLSGFLITSLLLSAWDADHAIDLKNFYVRRARRLLPALFVLLAAMSVYVLVTELPKRPYWTYLWSSVLYVRNVVAVPSDAPNYGLKHLWSLALEEQFYFVWPVVLVGLLHVRRWLAPVLAAVACIWIAVHRASASVHHTFGWLIRIETYPSIRADGLLIGCIAAFVWPLISPKAARMLAWLAVPAFVLIVRNGAFVDHWMWVWGWSVFYAATACIVLGAVNGWSGNRLLETRPLRLLGRVSYGLYLWHLPIIVAIERYGTSWPSWWAITVAWSLSAAATAISYRCVEQPFRSARREMVTVGS